MKNKSSYEDLQGHIRDLKMPAIETFKNQYADRDYTIEMSCPEFTCVCPKTGLPDFGTVRVTYSPDQMCVELKSFKLYLIGYRNVGIFHENLVNKVLDELVKACRPRQARVEGVVSPRGGIQTTVTAEYKRKK
jgi:7-cyano-7-deazaguanine reductase